MGMGQMFGEGGREQARTHTYTYTYTYTYVTHVHTDVVRIDGTFSSCS